MDTIQNIISFLLSVLRYWYVFLSGVPTFIFEAIPKLRTKYYKTKIFWRVIAIAGLIIAMFLVWQDEHNAKIQVERQLISVKYKQEIRFQIARFIEEGNKIKESCISEIEKPNLRPLYEDWVKRVTKYLKPIDPSYVPRFNMTVIGRGGGIGPKINEDIWNFVNTKNQVLIEILKDFHD